ncbi:hypothetical protein PVK06_007025 [Gossypium arboreum]|uniref:Uncharacterized protein n=1 Tax=Gossypium arboreum TaxID=29729 RepID=A0ABR0QGX9_GOSAR|nr:hypothetical protein PVK06_007025 [Gossypium arboreum]
MKEIVIVFIVVVVPVAMDVVEDTIIIVSKLYQASIQRKRKNIEKNLAYRNDNVEANLAHNDDGFKNFVDITHFDVEDFSKARNQEF